MKNVKGPRAGFNPKTASTSRMKPKAPVMTDNAKTSLGAQKQVMQPPQPFANPKGPVNLPVAQRFESKGTDFAGKGKAAKGTAIGGVKALPGGAAVGQKRMPDQSKQIGGRFGTSHPRKSGNPVSGQKAKRGSAFYGE